MKKKIAITLSAIMALLLLFVAIPPQTAQANTAWLDVTTDPVLQGFTADGDTSGVIPTPSGLVITDDSVSHIYYHKVTPDIPTRDIALLVWVRISYTRLDNNDTGVRLVLDEGVGGSRIEVGFCMDERGPLVYLWKYIDGEYMQSEGVVWPWGSGGDGPFGLRRDASGNAIIFDPPSGIVLDMVPRSELKPSSLPQPRFEFGCYSDPAEVTAEFIMIEEITAPSTPIVITSPNGGENWEVFSLQTITWTSTGVSGPVKIELSRDGGVTWTTLIPLTPNDGSQRWIVLRGATTQARIKVSSIANPTMFDISDADFTIVEPSITVTAPDGGESWKIGSTQKIAWDSTSVLLVKIELSRDSGATWTTIAAGIANHGSKSWKVTGPATTNARIRVVSLSNSASDISNADFIITP